MEIRCTFSLRQTTLNTSLKRSKTLYNKVQHLYSASLRSSAAQAVGGNVRHRLQLNQIIANYGMTREKDLEKLRFRLNLILIAGLCATTLAPSVIFYFRGEGELKWMIVFIVISYFVSRLPKSFYDRFQLSKDLAIYKKLAVDKFKKFSTNGDFINKKIRNEFPTYRNITNLETLKVKLNETYTVEKSHTVLFVFCLFTNIYAFWTNSLGTAIILLVGNILFNFYPNLLQQYNRIRYMRVIKKFPDEFEENNTAANII